MNDSRQYESSYREDYVLTSYTNPMETGRNLLTPLTPNIYSLNYKKNQFDAEHVLSSSPKQNYQMYKVTPHPLNMEQGTSNNKEQFHSDSENKENLQSNFHLFEPLVYEKLFEKKIDFSNLGMSSGKKSQKSILELSNESKKFIQRSIQQKIMSNSPISQKSRSSSSHTSSEDEQNDQNDSEEGIQLLSELQSELNSLINGSVQNSRTSSNNVSKHARTMQDIRSFGTGSNAESAVSKRCTNACQQLALKLEQLKANILNLHSKISSSVSANSVKKQPQILIQNVKIFKNPKKLIYPDSQIIFSRNDADFVDFNNEFSQFLNESYLENIQSSQPQNSKLHSSQSVINISLKNSLKSSQIKKPTILRIPKSQIQSQSKDLGNETEKFQTSGKISPNKFEIEKSAFKMKYPRFYDFENEQEQQSNIDESENFHLGNSHISSNSNEAFMLHELNLKFNSRLNELLQFNN